MKLYKVIRICQYLDKKKYLFTFFCLKQAIHKKPVFGGFTVLQLKKKRQTKKIGLFMSFLTTCILFQCSKSHRDRVKGGGSYMTPPCPNRVNTKRDFIKTRVH